MSARVRQLGGDPRVVPTWAYFGQLQSPTFLPRGENQRMKVIAATMGRTIQTMVLLSGFGDLPSQIFVTGAPKPVYLTMK